MVEPIWRTAGERQAGLLSIAQLGEVGVTRSLLRNQLRAERWDVARAGW